ncbi:hypothetical protein H8S37_04245 [Mediterraneibacter sp. NSJ-55]|uniref:Uncharacterized protein n=1 Tax=Mediterraneibacter hominis TaxID=2763054 RepID=A0A923LH18_9FIRM|nr:hypothetical protein [Mediterraneibacter hominis]MBC5688144.1 hypothetical protein [Mediterraneibacter hominis]
MDKLINIDDERLWNILHDEACVEGQQADRIYKALEDIAKSVAFDKEKVIEELEEAGQACNECDDTCGVEAIEYAIEIVEKGGI